MTPQRMTFWEHINELRARLRVVAIAVVVALIAVILLPIDPIYQFQHLDQYMNLQFVNNTFASWLLKQVVADVLPPKWNLIASGGVGEGMEIYFIAGILVAIGVCIPIIMYEAYRFIDPALKENERKLIYPFVLATSALFVVGISFGYFVLAHFLVYFLAPFFTAVRISYFVDAASFYYVVFLIVGATGISFTSPVIIYALISLHVLSADFFSKNRLMIWFVVWIIAGLFLTPDGGPLLDMVLFLPLIMLLELAVFFGRRRARGSGGTALFGSSPGSSDSPPPPAQNLDPACPFCGTRLVKGLPFCPSCGKTSSISQ
jgi:sec-independent protein translocase protein TatC